MDKRTFLKSLILGTAGVFVAGPASRLRAAKTRKKWDGVFRLPELPYAYNVLEPYIDAETMKLHHQMHHAGYTNKLNDAVSEAGLTGKTAHELLKQVSNYPVSIRNNGGGYLNHKLFWKMLAPATGQRPSPALTAALNHHFGSVENFQKEFSDAAKSVFGSGWVWLIAGNDGKLKITVTCNQDSPIMDVAEEKGIPLLCLDVWEHAYYVKNQNRRSDYISNFWYVVNWDFVSTRYDNLKKQRKV